MRWLAAALALFWAAPAAAHDPWVVYYADAVPPSALAGYRLAVLDADRHPALAPLKAAGTVTLGYLSLGEVEDHRAHYEAVRDEGLLLLENPVWRGSFMVDLRDPRWTRRVLDDLIPAILARGFDGIFYDTLDNAATLESEDPAAHAGMVAAAVRLVLAIRQRFPRMPVMMNRGYDLLPAALPAIDMLLGESVYGTFDFGTSRYRRTEPADYAWQVEKLRQAKAARPALKVMTLDYWDPRDSAGIARIYALQRGNGFHPYVATIELDRVVPEPPP
ncbi:MAG: hypothetical protein OHK0024_30010 [Thalassobaculales bacterium]